MSLGRHDLRLASRSQLHPCVELAEPPWATVAQKGGWHRLPLLQAPFGRMGGQAGTQPLLFSIPLPRTGSTSLPGASEGTTPVPGSQPGPTDADSERILMLGAGGELEQLDPTRPQRGPKSSPLMLPLLAAQEARCSSRSDGRYKLPCHPPPMHPQSSGGKSRTTAGL